MVKVKICGITRRSDALLASDLGASFLGFVFWEKSPRCIRPSQAKEIVSILPSTVTPVGVFVDASSDWIKEVASMVNLSVVQLHGRETVQYSRSLPYRVIKSVALQNPKDIAKAKDLPSEITVLIDAHDPIKKGGTGELVDWSNASILAKGRRVFLGGGLSPKNVAKAITEVRPYAIDASSRLELTPGVKDDLLLRAFFKAINSVHSNDTNQGIQQC